MAERVTRIMIHDSYLIKDSKDKYNIFIIYHLSFILYKIKITLT